MSNRRSHVFVSDTVLLETEWILRGTFRFAREEVLRALAAFVALPSVHVRDVDAADEALRLMAAGMDFADALHLVSAENCDAFITFDRALARRASLESATKVRLL